jgi:cohesin loading factor subunit SCC2
LIKTSPKFQDVGLGVRKRVMKLLKSFYAVTDQRGCQIDICTKMVLRMFDEDDTVKDLAIKTLDEMWFTEPAGVLQKPWSSAHQHSDDKSRIFSKTAVIMGVSANFKDRQSPLEEILHKIMAGKTGSDASALHARYTEVCAMLMDGLIDCMPGFVSVSSIRTTF